MITNLSKNQGHYFGRMLTAIESCAQDAGLLICTFPRIAVLRGFLGSYGGGDPQSLELQFSNAG